MHFQLKMSFIVTYSVLVVGKHHGVPSLHARKHDEVSLSVQLCARKHDIVPYRVPD